jgi:hypothetical protein
VNRVTSHWWYQRRVVQLVSIWGGGHTPQLRGAQLDSFRRILQSERTVQRQPSRVHAQACGHCKRLGGKLLASPSELLASPSELLASPRKLTLPAAREQPERGDGPVEHFTADALGRVFDAHGAQPHVHVQPLLRPVELEILWDVLVGIVSTHCVTHWNSPYRFLSSSPTLFLAPTLYRRRGVSEAAGRGFSPFP